MSFEAWFTVIVVGLCLAALISNRVGPDTVMMGGLSLLLVTGIVTPAQGLAGFANEGMITVGVLFVVVAGLRDTGAVGWIVQHLLGRPRGLADAQLRIMTPVSLMSAFLNNTPVVAMMIPAIQDWGRRFQISPSRLLIPLSYAAIAGGTCTLIGTSTNLVIHGLLLERTGEGFSMFELAWIGIPLVVLVMACVMMMGRRLLPERVPATTQFADARRYTVEMLVAADGALVGKTVEQAGLRQLPGLYLIEIDRGDLVIPAPGPTDVLLADDRLVFAGAVESVVDLQKINGLLPATNQIFKLGAPRPERCLVEAVISRMHPMVGKSIRAGRFRSVYNAAVIAVSRSGEQVKGKIGDIVLRPGDTLLLEAHPSFVVQQRTSRDFYLVSELEESAPLRHERAPLALLILVGMVMLAAFDIMSMLNASLLAAGAMLITRCTRGRVARRSVDWQILIVIAASIGIGNALHATGAAQAIADSMLALVGSNPWSVLLMVYVMTALFTAVVTNNTAAVLMFPIVFALAESMGVNYMPFIITVTVAASMSFATPIGYQTNLMVMGPGGYRFTDYFYLGIPITVLVGVLVMAIVPQVWPF
ncbi:MAG: SLC13 family permease [Gammaproteobacteria bacterium]|jgi:di/tricarboxylate transporter|nr:SLC13 family permease [Gammaproteobacteria bacterium]